MASPRVQFLIAGTQKGGTSALDAYLRDHPGIAMASRKEVHFFDDDERFAPGRVPDYAWYERFFADAPPGAVAGEATPIYMYWHAAPERIRAYNPAMKLVVVLRNPITRAFSHWNMEHARGAERLSFWRALQSEDTRCRAARPAQHRVYSYVDRGFYTQQLARVWATIPRAQTLVIRHERLKSDPQAVLDEVCDFIGVERMAVAVRKDVHTLAYAQALAEREWRFLAERFEGEIGALERLFGWDCSDWLRAPAMLAR